MSEFLGASGGLPPGLDVPDVQDVPAPRFRQVPVSAFVRTNGNFEQLANERELEAVDGAVSPTTLMLKRLPRSYLTEELKDELESLGFLGNFDFVHVPWDDKHNRNRGFAFVNFTTSLAAATFYKMFNGRSLRRCVRALEVAPADVQGLQPNYERFATSSASNVPWFASKGPLEKRPALLTVYRF